MVFQTRWYRGISQKVSWKHFFIFTRHMAWLMGLIRITVYVLYTTQWKHLLIAIVILWKVIMETRLEIVFSDIPFWGLGGGVSAHSGCEPPTWWHQPVGAALVAPSAAVASVGYSDWWRQQISSSDFLPSKLPFTTSMRFLPGILWDTCLYVQQIFGCTF